MSSEYTILIIDDDRMTRQMLQQIMEMYGYKTAEATGGQNAIEVLGDTQVDAVLLDLHLADGYGADFIAPIKELSCAPIIVVSGQDDEEIKQACIDKGATGFVAKPFMPDILVAKIGTLIKQA